MTPGRSITLIGGVTKRLSGRSQICMGESELLSVRLRGIGLNLVAADQRGLPAAEAVNTLADI